MKHRTDAATQNVADIYAAFKYFAQLLHSRQGTLSRNDGVTGAQLRAIRVLEAGPLSMGALSDRLYVQPSTVSGMVDRLEAKGLVERSRSNEDRRRVQVGLTPAGKQLVAAAPESVVQLVLDRLHDLPPDDLAVLHHAVARMHRMLATALEDVGRANHAAVGLT